MPTTQFIKDLEDANVRLLSTNQNLRRENERLLAERDGMRNALMSREKISRWAQENDAPWVEVPADWLRALEEALSQEPKRKESP